MDPIKFIHTVTISQLPEETIHAAKRAILDTLGVVLTGTQTETAGIVYNYTADLHPGKVPLLLDGRSVSVAGAALALGAACDSLDSHDGYQPARGHAGCALVPAAVALARELPELTGEEWLELVVIGYEISLRAGTTLHASAPDYHSSGAWSAIGVAAMYARAHHMSEEQTKHALGIAEYYGPRAEMMRCIATPTMVKDSSSWGAFVGIQAAQMAKYGFTGAPAVTVEINAAERIARVDKAQKFWGSLGSEWLVRDLVYKKHVLCAWSQTAAHGARLLRNRHGLDPTDVASVEVETFAEAASMMSVVEPRDTDTAQYSLPFGVGAVLVHDVVTAREVCGEQLKNKEVLRIAKVVRATEAEDLSRLQPDEMLSRVSVVLHDGRRFSAEATAPEWFVEGPTDDMLNEKFRVNVEQVASKATAKVLMERVWELEKLGKGGVKELLDLVTAPVAVEARGK